MAISNRQERRTIQRLRRAEKDPAKVLRSDCYWNVEFLRRFLRRCDDVGFHEPAKALKMSTYVVELSDRLAQCEGRYVNEAEQRAYQVLARAVRASFLRQAGEYQQSEELYRRAFLLADSRSLDRNIRAELHTRFATLLFVQGNHQAINQVEQALELFDDHALYRPAALILRGAISTLLEKKVGLAYYAEAMRGAVHHRTTKIGRRHFLCALHALAKDVGDTSSSIDEQRQAFQSLMSVKKAFASRSRSVPKCLVIWQLARIAGNLALGRHAVRLFHRARKGLRELNEPFEFALCSLDLIAYCLREGEQEAAIGLGEEMLEHLESNGNAALFDALSNWQIGTAVTLQKIASAQEAVTAMKEG